MAPVTDLTKYRMMRQKPATDLFRWHEVIEQITLSNIQLFCAVQRNLARLLIR